MKLRSIDAIMHYIIKSTFYKYGCGGDKYILACLSRIIALGQQFDCGNYSLRKANLFSKKNKVSPSPKYDALSLYALQSCIIAYSGCYDTILQIVNFGLHLSGPIQTKQDLKNIIEECKWQTPKNDQLGFVGLEDKLKARLPNVEIYTLISKINELFRHRSAIASYANSLKHGGGLVTNQFMHYIPDMKIIEGVTVCVNKKDNSVKIDIDERMTPFDVAWLYPKEIVIADTINQMFQQNQYIYDFVEYFWSVMEFNQINKMDPLKDTYKVPFLN